jgi:hypothetical protein
MRFIVLTCCGETVPLPPDPRAVGCPGCGEPFTECDIEELACAQAPMMRPLFEEPTVDIEREDPWSGPKGFMLGGWSLPTPSEMAKQYLEAADALVDAIKQNEMEDYRIANPVLFLYRHAAEMTLKGIMYSAPKTHDLSRLADDFDAFIKDKCGQSAPPWITTRLKEIAGIDPNSTAFRYGEYQCKGPNQAALADGEIYIDLFHVQRSMKALIEALDRVYALASQHAMRQHAQVAAQG